MTPERLKYWLKGEKTQNFGDYLSEFILKSLFVAFDEGTNLHLIGSVIDDGMIPLIDDAIDPAQPRASFWGCGIRTRGGLLLANKAHIDLFAVRGPLSASDLRLGSSVPIGDPGLLLPALYSPRIDSVSQGKAVCIPHFHDQRPDQELLSLAGADVVLRSSILGNEDAVRRFIDTVASADFVLSASLHGAVVAVAYGRPFAFWDNGLLDLPTKWEDFASYSNFEMHALKTTRDAKAFYKKNIAPNLRIPSLWPLLANAPCQIKPLALLRVLKYELNREGNIAVSEALQSKIEPFQANSHHFERLAERTRNYFQKRLEAGSKKLAERTSELVAATAHAAEQAAESQMHLDEERASALKNETRFEARLEELSHELRMSSVRTQELKESHRIRTLSLERDLQESEFRFGELNKRLSEERTAFTQKEMDAKSRIAASKNDLDISNAQSAAMSLALEDMSARLRGHEQDLQKSWEELKRAAQSVNEQKLATAMQERHHATQLARLSKELNLLKAREEKANAIGTRLQAESADMAHQLIESRDQVDALRATLVQNELDLIIERNAKAALNSRVSRLEQEMITRVGNAVGRPRLFGHVFGRSSLNRRALADQVQRIEDYIGLFETSRIMGPGEGDRRDRVIKFLLNASDGLADLPFFEVPIYLSLYKASLPAGVNPLIHYLSCPPRDKQRPHILFDTEYYLDKYPDSAETKMDIFAHFVKWGADRGFNPHPLFDTQYYFARYPDVAVSRVNPLIHYLRCPGCWPHPLFDTDYYLKQSPLVVRSGRNPLVHYLTEGALAGLDPHPWFSTRFYVDGYQDVAAAGMNPLVHYLRFGAREGRNPHPAFSTNAYMEAHPELHRSGENPLCHFVLSKKSEGVSSNPITSASVSLTSQVFNPTKSSLANQRRTVLMVDAYYPRPDKDSGSMDQVSYVKIFQTLGYEVYFAADLELGVETSYRNLLESMQVKCVVYPEYQSVEDFLKRHSGEIAVCFLSRVHFGTRHIKTIRQLCPAASIIYNTVDLHHIREKRQAELAGDTSALATAKETYAAEAAATRDADATIVVSSQEAAYWQSQVSEAKIFLVPLIRDYKVGRSQNFEARRAIAFLGGFRHMPNIDAVTYFLDDIWPLVRASLPDVEFRVIGADLPDSLSCRSDVGVKFVGFVEDLDAYLAEIRLTVAPLRYGAGAKGKVVSSLAFGVPCVASSIASEGMGLTDGIDVMVGDSPAQFAEKIVALYCDPTLWTAQSDNGMKLINERHSLSRGVQLVRDIISSALSPNRSLAQQREFP